MAEMPSDLIALPTMPYNERPPALPLDVEECRTAIWLTRGNITKAAEMLKTTSMRLRIFIKNSPRLSAELNEAKERILDIAEEVAYDALTDEQDPGRRDTMARFVMTNLGKDRGYGNGTGGVSLNVPKGGKILISWEDGTQIQGESPRTNDNTIEGEVVRG